MSFALTRSSCSGTSGGGAQAVPVASAAGSSTTQVLTASTAMRNTPVVARASTVQAVQAQSARAVATPAPAAATYSLRGGKVTAKAATAERPPLRPSEIAANSAPPNTVADQVCNWPRSRQTDWQAEHTHTCIILSDRKMGNRM